MWRNNHVPTHPSTTIPSTLEQGQDHGPEITPEAREIWAIRIKLRMENRLRGLALFNLAIDSKLRACDLVKIKLSDVSHGAQIARRAIVLQQKTPRPVQFELADQTRDSVSNWVNQAGLSGDDYLFKSRVRRSEHISTRQYARIVESWVTGIGLDPAGYGTHSLRRTKAALIYRRTRNLRAVQILPGHSKLESTVRYLGIEVDDALEMAEQTEV